MGKATGNATLVRPSDYIPTAKQDLLEDTIREIFDKADTDGNGILTDREFWNLMRSDTLGLGLTSEEVASIKEQYDQNKDGHIDFHEFVPLCRKLIMMVYNRSSDTSSDWVRLSSMKAG